jgi:hypothetical protein
MAAGAPVEWMNLFVSDLIRQMERRGTRGLWAQRVMQDPDLQGYLARAFELMRVRP